MGERVPNFLNQQAFDKFLFFLPILFGFSFRFRKFSKLQSFCEFPLLLVFRSLVIPTYHNHVVLEGNCFRSVYVLSNYMIVLFRLPGFSVLRRPAQQDGVGGFEGSQEVAGFLTRRRYPQFLVMGTNWA